MERFDQIHSYKLIYVFSMPYETHKGLLKAGEATLATETMPNNLVPNYRDLNQAAIKRIGSYTKTAIKCVKEDKSLISSGSVVKETPCTPIDFREEQNDVVEKTLKAFKKDNEMIWYQKANRFVYCNLLENLLLHVKIAENPDAQAKEYELPGIGGAINFICKNLNDIYSGKEFTEDWRKTVAEKVKDSFDDYIAILRCIWNVIESNSIYKAIITKDMLCVGWDGKVVKKVMYVLNDGE